MASVSTRETASAPRASCRTAIVEVLASPWRLASFVIVAGAVTLLYTILLPFSYTQRFELANWGYLDGYLMAWSVVLGVSMGFVVMVQLYAMRRVAVSRASGGAAGGLAFVVSLLTSFLCCTPIVPTFLAFVGVSGVGLYSTTGVLQHFFATHETEFLSASLVLLAATGWWSLRKVAGASCLSDDGCDIAPRRASTESPTVNATTVEEGALR